MVMYIAENEISNERFEKFMLIIMNKKNYLKI